MVSKTLKKGKIYIKILEKFATMIKSRQLSKNTILVDTKGVPMTVTGVATINTERKKMKEKENVPGVGKRKEAAAGVGAEVEKGTRNTKSLTENTQGTN